MTIEVCSQSRAVELAAVAKHPTSVISIVSTDEAEVAFEENPNLQSVLRLRFNDLTDEADEEGIPYGEPVPAQKDFEGLKEFVDVLDCDHLIIHCWEGSSRSAAVAAAVYEYRGSKDTLKKGERFCPNPLVHTLARRELFTTQADRSATSHPMVNFRWQT